MFTKQQQLLLQRFADISDKAFELGIITTDSFTGEIGEYVACKHFYLIKAPRVTKAFDAVCKAGKRYQVKAKIVANNNFNFTITNLHTSSFDFLVVVYFDQDYSPIKIVRIASGKIKNNKTAITAKLLNSGIEAFDKQQIKIPVKHRQVINEFAKSYNDLEANGIIRSRRVVGDIGEFYACNFLDLEICNSKTEKGIDARHKNGLTFEVKTRRVYKSGRRIGESRRINNLNGKSADYLVVVALDQAFKCAGIWLIPMKNLVSVKSPHLEIVNHTPGTLTVVPSTISWLNTGKKFTGFNATMRKPLQLTRSNAISSKEVTKCNSGGNANRAAPIKTKSKKPENIYLRKSVEKLAWAIIIIFIIYLLNMISG